MTNDNGDDLFSMYPERPGWKKQETSALAAEAVASKAPVLRKRCLDAVAASPAGMTGNELVDALGWDICSVRPRLTELNRLGHIRKRMDGDKESRRSTPSGCSAIVWEAVPADEQRQAA